MEKAGPGRRFLSSYWPVWDMPGNPKWNLPLLVMSPLKRNMKEREWYMKRKKKRKKRRKRRKKTDMTQQRIVGGAKTTCVSSMLSAEEAVSYAKWYVSLIQYYKEE